MFSLKILRNFPKVSFYNLGENNSVAPVYRLFSNDVPPTETTQIQESNSTAKPDKLYKKLEIEVRGNDRAVLKSFGIFAVTAASHLGITVGGNYAPYKAIHERLTLLKSKHVHKKHRVQYEIRTYYRFLDILKITGSTADTFLEYIQRNLPEGVAMKVTKIELQRLPESISTPPS